ncbi:MAG TPA: hypothetical protein VFT50_18730 [Baekduia sp.]|nr:hypothetical protein [Baekduia sp.]
MATTTPPIAETIEAPRRRLLRPRAIRRAAWLVADLGATAAFAAFALHAL